MAHKKAGGSTRNGRDSQAKRRGVKLFGGETVQAGSIVIRQKGTNFFPGENCRMGVDYTIFALKPGKIIFEKRKRTRFDGQKKLSTFVSIK